MKTKTNCDRRFSSAGIQRRVFLKNVLLIGTGTMVGGMISLEGCRPGSKMEDSPAEILMRQHGMLARLMLVYDKCSQDLSAGKSFPIEALRNAALIIRSYIEDFHENLEGEILFPYCSKSDSLSWLVQLLYIQHAAGRKLTDRILSLCQDTSFPDPERGLKLSQHMTEFNRMYRLHAAWEDTVLLPELKKLLGQDHNSSLAEEISRRQQEVLGINGTENLLDRIAAIERMLEIHQLWQVTPEG